METSLRAWIFDTFLEKEKSENEQKKWRKNTVLNNMLVAIKFEKMFASGLNPSKGFSLVAYQ